MNANSPNNGQRVSPQDFFYLNLFVTVVFGLWFLRSRKQRTPSRLKFKNQKKQPSHRPTMEAVEEEPPPSRGESKNLNVMFNYNGHCWDAYEVLGVPAGSSLKAVEQHFNESLKKARKESEPFLRAAYEAIVQDVRKASQS